MSSDIPRNPGIDPAISASESYARGVQGVREFQKITHAPRPSDLKPPIAQTQVAIATPTLAALEALFNVHARKSWGTAEAPPGYYDQRLFSPYLMQSVPNLEASIQKLEGYLSKASGREQEEGQRLLRCLHEGIREPNDMIGYVIAKISGESAG